MRGNQRTSGELSRREGGKIFGSGSRTPIAITILVKKPGTTTSPAQIHYADIGDYLSREEKLAKIKAFGSILNPEMKLSSITPNEAHDWINQRDGLFETMIPMEPVKKYDCSTHSYFVINTRGLETSRDTIVYNSSLTCLEHNVHNMIDGYNLQRVAYQDKTSIGPPPKVENFVTDENYGIVWTRGTKNDLTNNVPYEYSKSNCRTTIYRPFFKQNGYLSSHCNEYVNHWPRLFPTPQTENLVICVPGVGVTKDFSVIMVNLIPDLEIIGKSQCFPLFYYEKVEHEQLGLFDQHAEGEYIRRDGVSDFILTRARQLNPKITKEDIFFYVYGLLHSREYCERFSADLKKMLPRIPLAETYQDLKAFCVAGRKLAGLHLNYETGPLCSEVQVVGTETCNFRVDKMRFPSKEDKSTILYNSHIRIENIPGAAYQYVINGKSAIEWIMERYQVTINPDSQIRNDPNCWAEEHQQPRYILDLLLRIIQMSLDTMSIVARLPHLPFGETDD